MRKSENFDIKSGVLWNLASYIFLGIFTVLIYLLIIWRYGKAELGAYNIVLSVYMLCGQIGGWGLQSTAVFNVPQIKEEKKKLGSCFSSFVLIALFISILLGIILWLGAGFIGDIVFHSRYVYIGLKTIPSAIILFSVNKVICSFINSLGNMKLFSVLQTARYAIICGGIAAVAISKIPFRNVFYVFVIAEAGVLVLGVISILKRFKPAMPERMYVKEGFCFGAKAMLGNVVGDINSRIDIMMLGILCNESIVGLYSFVSVIAEGFVSLLYVFRNNYNPLFSDLLYKNKLEDLTGHYKKIKMILPVFFGAAGFLVVLGYTGVCMLFLDAEYMRSVLAVIITAFGFTAMSAYFTCGNLCTLKGHPLVDTIIMLTTIVCNLGLNYIFISLWDIVGAALATALSYLLYMIMMRYFINKYVM